MIELTKSKILLVRRCRQIEHVDHPSKLIPIEILLFLKKEKEKNKVNQSS